MYGMMGMNEDVMINPRGNPSLEETSRVVQELSKSQYYDPNLDFVTCLSLVVLSILCTLCILVPIFTVLLASSSSTNWFGWVMALVFFLGIIAAIAFCIYR
jgi:hypothetical protein